MTFNKVLSAIFAVSALTFASEASAAKYSPGASDKEIKIGNTAPYTGPVAIYSRPIKTIDAYFKMLNEKGGINGRQIKFISYDDSYDPKKTMKQIHKLIEDDQVLVTLFTIGTPSNLAIRRYMNDHEIPQLFVGSGAYLFNMPKEFPWTNQGVPDYISEATSYAKYVLENKPDAKIAILYQNDDYGKLYLNSFLKALGDKAEKMVVSLKSYEVRDHNIKDKMKELKDSGADVFLDISTAKFGIQAIENMYILKWKPLHIMTVPVASRENVFSEVGFDRVQGAISSQVTKDPADPVWAKDKDMIEYKAFMKKHMPNLDPNDVFIVLGYIAANVAEEVLKRCGDDLTRENIIKVRNNLEFEAPLLLPGIKVQVTENDFRLVKQMQIVRFEDKYWKPVGNPTPITD